MLVQSMRPGANIPGIDLGKHCGSLNVAVHWTEALHGRCALHEALHEVVRAFDVEVARLVRLRFEPDEQIEIAEADRSAQRRPLVKIEACATSAILADRAPSAKVGSLWFLSDVWDGGDADRNAPLARALARRQVNEVIVLVLECCGTETDVLELYFSRKLGPDSRAQIQAVARPMCDAWIRRRPNIVDFAIAAQRRESAGSAVGGAVRSILGPSNPAELSRAEYRVCALLSVGLTARRISEKLGITEATVRSHLRNIYAKTSTSGQCELLHRILVPEADVPDGLAATVHELPLHLPQQMAGGLRSAAGR